MSGMNLQFPGESKAYREARNALLEAEIALRAHVEAVAKLRRQLPAGGVVDDYVFAGATGQISLSQLFGDKDQLIIYSYMYTQDDETPCPMCTAFLDEANGSARHIQGRVAFTVVARSSIEKLLEMGDSRNWHNLKLVSAADNTFAQDFHSETPDGKQTPMCHVFVRDGDQIRHFWSSEMLFAESETDPRHIDQLWGLWNFFDLTPQGRGDHYPTLEGN